jgi:hypothetical protein
MKKSLFTAFAVGLCMTASVMAQVPNYVPTNGLVGWWPFNGNANDESGNGNNGTVSGATLASDRNSNINASYNFNGATNKIDLPPNSNIQGNAPRSISFWFKPTSTNIYDNIIYKGGNNGSGNDFSIIMKVVANNKCIIMVRRYIDDIFSDSIDYNLNQWNHYCIVYNGTVNSNIKIFKNGIEQLGRILPGSGLTFNTSSTSPEFGHLRDQLNVDYYLFGSLDDIGIWNRALSECEIQDLYNSQLGSFSNANVSVNPTSSLIGSNTTLTVSSPVSSLQWQSNPGNMGWNNVVDNGNYNGAANDTLVVSNLQLSNHNQSFRVLACGDTSNIATFQIADTCITNVTDTTFITVTDTNVVTVYDTLLTTVIDTLIINTTLGLPAPNNENTILIYPNPASDHITIENGNYTAMAGYTIKIENNLGQQVFQSAINQQQFYVDLSTWSGNGLYFVHIIDAQNNTVTVRKIVLQ